MNKTIQNQVMENFDLTEKNDEVDLIATRYIIMIDYKSEYGGIKYKALKEQTLKSAMKKVESLLKSEHGHIVHTIELYEVCLYPVYRKHMHVKAHLLQGNEIEISWEWDNESTDDYFEWLPFDEDGNGRLYAVKIDKPEIEETLYRLRKIQQDVEREQKETVQSDTKMDKCILMFFMQTVEQLIDALTTADELLYSDNADDFQRYKFYCDKINKLSKELKGIVK
jgi:hypothetical protein